MASGEGDSSRVSEALLAIHANLAARRGSDLDRLRDPESVPPHLRPVFAAARKAQAQIAAGTFVPETADPTAAIASKLRPPLFRGERRPVGEGTSTRRATVRHS